MTIQRELPYIHLMVPRTYLIYPWNTIKYFHCKGSSKIRFHIKSEICTTSKIATRNEYFVLLELDTSKSLYFFTP